MLKDLNVAANIPVKNIEAARKFYGQTLGLTEVGREGSELVAYRSGKSDIFVYRSNYAGTNQATAMTWPVDEDIESIVSQLKAQGIKFEHYDNMPDTRIEGDIHVGQGMKVAWFKDPDGNILNLAESVRTVPRDSIEISRVFQATAKQLWDAWTKPELIQRWWGPEDFTSPGAKVDFRTGGKYLFGMRAPDNREYWSTGTYLEIVDQRRIVCTDQFADSNGNVISPEQAGMPGDWPKELKITLTFEDLPAESKTKLNLRHQGLPPEIRDECIAGWAGSLNKLQNVVENGKT